MTKSKLKEMITLVVVTVVFTIITGWCTFFSPWAQVREYTPEEMFEAALQYDEEHGTNYAMDYIDAVKGN